MKNKFCKLVNLKNIAQIVLILIVLPAFATPIEQMEIYEGGMYSRHSVTPQVGDTKKGEFPVIEVDREKGYYVDGRNQFPEYQHIQPPNPEMIPKNPHPTKTVEPFASYYDRNIKGLRRQPYMTPIIPNYNRFYSNRVAKPYTRKEFIDVWCAGIKDYDNGTCTTKEYVTYFHPVRNWAGAVTSIPFRAKRVKNLGKKIAFFLWVDDLAGDAPYMHDSKDFVNRFNIPTFYGTIDSAIPQSWFP